MAHDHDHGLRDEQLGVRLIASLAINVTIMVAQLVGGVLAGSLALVTDALHNVSDVVALGLSYVAFRVSKRPATTRYTFAFQRSEVLAATVNSAALIGVSIFVAVEAVQRLMNPAPVEGGLVVAFAAFGMVANAIAALLIRGHGSNINLRAAMLHLVSDSVASLGVLAAGLVIQRTGWYFVDPLVSLALAAWMIWESVKITRSATHILMQGVPEDIELEMLLTTMQDVDGVAGVHDLHVWAVAPENVILSAHVVVDDEHLPASTAVLAELKQVLHDEFGVEHATFELEHSEAGCAGGVCVLEE